MNRRRAAARFLPHSVQKAIRNLASARNARAEQREVQEAHCVQHRQRAYVLAPVSPFASPTPTRLPPPPITQTRKRKSTQPPGGKKEGGGERKQKAPPKNQREGIKGAERRKRGRDGRHIWPPTNPTGTSSTRTQKNAPRSLLCCGLCTQSPVSHLRWKEPKAAQARRVNTLGGVTRGTKK